MKNSEIYNNLKKSITKENMELISLLSKDFNYISKKLNILKDKYNSYAPSVFHDIIFPLIDHERTYIENLNSKLTKKFIKKYKNKNVSIDYIIGNHPIKTKEPILKIENEDFEIMLNLRNLSLFYYSKECFVDDDNVFSFFTFFKTKDFVNSQFRTFIDSKDFFIEKKHYIIKTKECNISQENQVIQIEEDKKYSNLFEKIEENDYFLTDLEYLKDIFSLTEDFNTQCEEFVFLEQFLSLKSSSKSIKHQPNQKNNIKK